MYDREGKEQSFGSPFDFGNSRLASVAKKAFLRLPLYKQYITFAVVLMKREVIQKVGYLDESFELGFEDTEFCFRAQNSGFRIADSDIRALHLSNTSSRSIRSAAKSVKGFVIFYRRLRWSIAKIMYVGAWWTVVSYSRRFFDRQYKKID